MVRENSNCFKKLIRTGGVESTAPESQPCEPEPEAGLGSCGDVEPVPVDADGGKRCIVLTARPDWAFSSSPSPLITLEPLDGGTEASLNSPRDGENGRGREGRDGCDGSAAFCGWGENVPIVALRPN